MTKSKLGLIIGTILIALTLIIGGYTMKQKQDELKRNREYEASLVKALKNSYRDIEEIKLTNPYYLNKPGEWGCTVLVLFSDSVKVEYGISHSVGLQRNKAASATAEVLDLLETYYGVTEDEVLVLYSDGDEGKI